MLWSRQQSAFAVEAHFSNGWSVFAVQRAFRHHFDIHPRNRVPPDRKCVLMWMDAFRATGNVFKERELPLKTVRTSENVQRVRVPIQYGVTMIQKFFLPVLKERNLHNVRL
ncbi:DUF4817 domain-containing protein [Trichonephila clavipes]|nr:DUF4817 domain-containing protein [Trichonephila clavipes]